MQKTLDKYKALLFAVYALICGMVLNDAWLRVITYGPDTGDLILIGLSLGLFLVLAAAAVFWALIDIGILIEIRADDEDDPR